MATLPSPTRASFTSPPAMTRNFSLTSQASSASGGGGGPPSAAGSDKKKRARTLLRDYYGLAATAEGAAPKKGDPMDIDSPASFNPDVYFDSLASTASLPDLLRKENELIVEIRELDGERQSLVYNHHSELIDASETIKKMKSRALALDASLDNLKTSFQSISQLSTSLASTPARPHNPNPPHPSTAAPSHKTPPRRPSQPTPTSGKRLSTLLETPTVSVTSPQPPPPAPKAAFDPLVHLPVLLSLPLLLRHSDKKAELWEDSVASLTYLLSFYGRIECGPLRYGSKADVGNLLIPGPTPEELSTFLAGTTATVSRVRGSFAD
ncbi:hypothetical protein RQP46_001763 [Phenoliferia psychrophenolica]